jgi:hypothetical protein
MLAFGRQRALRWAALAALLLASRLPAASPRDELLRYVPEDAGFCLVVQNLRGHAADLLGSPFARAWGRSPLGVGIGQSDELKKLRKVDGYLVKHLGVGWTGLRDDILGEAFVFAYRPGPADKPDQEQGLFLLRARNEKLLASLVEKLNELQKGTGEVKGLVEREYRGVKYTRRVEGKASNYYLLRGPVLLYTGQEAMLRQAIDRDRALTGEAKPPLARKLEDLGLDRALLALMLAPRSLDASIASKAANEPAAKAFAGLWKALQGVGLGVHLDRDLRFSLTVKAKTDQLPAPARRFLQSAARASELWSAFPPNALVAAAGRLDTAALYDLLGEFLTRTSKDVMEENLSRSLGAVLGKDVAKEVLPALGPDWGLCVTAPPAQSKHWAPRALFALRVAATDANDPVDQALLSAVHTWAQLAVLGHNKAHPRQPISLRSLTQDKVRVRYLHGEAFPGGFQPAFALKAGYLVLASSPDEVKRFKIGSTPAGGTVPLLRLSVKALRDFLRLRRDGLAGALAVKDNTTREKAREKIDAIRGSLELIDRVELSQKTAAGQLTLTLQVQTAQALKK